MIYNDVELAKHSLDKCWFNFNIIVLTKNLPFLLLWWLAQFKNSSIVGYISINLPNTWKPCMENILVLHDNYHQNRT